MDDTSFGPRLLGRFDFTLLFEHTIFQIVPSVLAIFAAVFYVYKIFRATAIVRSGALLYIKLGFAAALVAIQVANLVLWSTSPLDHLDAKVARIAAAFSLVGSLCIAAVVYAGHVFFLRSPAFLGLFLTVSLPLDIVTTLTYHNRSGLGKVAALSISVPVLKLVILLLEEVSKRSLVRKEELGAGLGNEGFAGFWNKSLFVWLNPLLLFGFRYKIRKGNLPDLSRELASDGLYRRFAPLWEKKQDKTSWHALASCCMATIPWPFLYVLLPRALVIGFLFSQPFLLQDIVDEVSSEESHEDIQHGLMTATAIVYVGLAVSRSWYAYIKNQLLVSVRVILISAIYHKSLRLSAEDLRKSKAITLVNADIMSINTLVNTCYDSCASVAEVALGLGMLAKFVGPATIFALIPTILTTAVVSFVAKRAVGTHLNWNKHIDDRIASTSNVLAQSKEIKMLGLGPAMVEHLDGKFEAETQAALKDRNYFVATLTLAAFADSVTPVVVIAGTIFWSRKSDTLTASDFFTTLAFVKLASDPLVIFLEFFPYWTNGFASLKRIQEYLAIPEKTDTRNFVSAPAECHSVAKHVVTGTNIGHSTAVSGQSSSMEAETMELQTMHVQKPSAPARPALEMLNLSMTTDSSDFIVKDVSLSIPTGSVAMFCGPVGCGKSSLLKSALGEIAPSAGQINLGAETVAYCGQAPWIINTTIQNNVVGRGIFNAARYAKVISMCALDVDFAQLPDGDQTMAGTEGCNLSGGQKSRISLARALYLDADLVLLDDLFSSLDKETSAAVRGRIFGQNGLASNGRTTVILATNTSAHLKDADAIYRMDGKGSVEKLTWEEYRQSVGISAEEVEQYTQSDSTDTSASPVEPPKVKPSATDEVFEDQTDLKSGDFSLYKYFVGPAGAFFLAVEGLLLLVAGVGERMPQIFARIWVERDPNNKVYFYGYLLFGLANPILHILSIGGFYHLVNARASMSLHGKLAQAVTEATFEFLMAEDANFLLNRFSIDTSMATQSLPQTIIPVIWVGLMLLIDIGVIASGASYAAPIMPCFLLVVYLIQRFYLKTSRQLRGMQLDNSKLLTRHFSETGAGIEHIRALGWRDAFVDDFHEIVDFVQKPFYLLYAINQWLRSVTDLTTAFCAVAIVSLAVNFKNSASPASVGLALLSLIGFSETASLFVRFYVSMEMAFGAVFRIRSFVSGTPREDDSKAGPVSENWPESGKLELRGVTAVYKPDSDKPHTALDDVSVTIEAGETVGLVGRTGSGKSSLLLTLLHLIEYSGSISIDGRDIKTVPRSLLRQRITTITQAGLELKGSVRLNLDPSKYISRPPRSDLPAPTDDDLISALERVGLWHLVEEAGGLDADMTKLKLSHGQRQLFQLARAIFHHGAAQSRVVLIDEGTASMDEETEARVKRLMEEVFAGCTKIFISHRPTLLSEAQVILRLDAGKAQVERPGRDGERKRIWNDQGEIISGAGGEAPRVQRK